MQTPELRDKWIGYAVSLLLIVLVSAAGFYARHHLARTNLAMLYLLSVVVSAIRYGRGPAIFTAVSGSLIFGRFFIPPFVPGTGLLGPLRPAALFKDTDFWAQGVTAGIELRY